MFYRQRRGWAGADHDLSQLGICFDVDMRKFKEEISEGKLEALLQDGQKEGIQRHVYRILQAFPSQFMWESRCSFFPLFGSSKVTRQHRETAAVSCGFGLHYWSYRLWSSRLDLTLLPAAYRHRLYSSLAKTDKNGRNVQCESIWIVRIM